MSLTEIPALTRLRDLDEVSAAFVYSRDGLILAAAVPGHYTEATLEQLVRRLKQITDLVDKAKIRLRETRFTFEGFTVWLKVFGSDMTLVVFVQPKASIFPLRQPINLTVVNLEKAITAALYENEAVSEESLTAMAHRAEMELLRSQTGYQDQIFLEQLNILVETFIGPHGQDYVNQSLREMNAGTAFDSRATMQALVDLVGAHIANVERRQFFLTEAGDVIDRNERDLPPPPTSAPVAKP
jgi:predicted regulator of Ras-like GTPase activity (Roadblock/LC7/MglB family)